MPLLSFDTAGFVGDIALEITEHMHFLIAFLKSASRPATYLAAGALAFLAAKVLVLNRWPAAVSAVYDLGVLVEAILASIVASYVFYLLVVHLKEMGDRTTVSPYIDRHTNRVVDDCERQLGHIGSASGTSLSLDNLTKQAVLIAFSKLAPYAEAPLVLGTVGNNANWLQYFDYYKTATRGSIARVFAQLIYLDARRVRLLAEIDDCSHFSAIGIFLYTPIGNSDLSNFAPAFSDYCEICLELKRFMAKQDPSCTLA